MPRCAVARSLASAHRTRRSRRERGGCTIATVPHDDAPSEDLPHQGPPPAPTETVVELDPVLDGEDTVSEVAHPQTATDLDEVPDVAKTVLGLPEVRTVLSLEPVRDNLKTVMALPEVAAPPHREQAVPIDEVVTIQQQVAPRRRPTAAAGAVKAPHVWSKDPRIFVGAAAVLASVGLLAWLASSGGSGPSPSTLAVKQPTKPSVPTKPEDKASVAQNGGDKASVAQNGGDKASVAQNGGEKVAPPPGPPLLVLDAVTEVVEPLAAHLPDVALDPAHKYRLTLRPSEARLGVVTARLEQNGEWGQLNEMASHYALQFAGVTALRLHCTTGLSFRDDSVLQLDLEDLARHVKTPLAVEVAKHCLDASKFHRLPLGAKAYRVRLPNAQSATLGDKVPLKVAWRVKKPDQSWRSGTLAAGGDVLVEGQYALFAVLDSYAADNAGQVKLELLAPETVSGGLAKDRGAVEFVPVK